MPPAFQRRLASGRAGGILSPFRFYIWRFVHGSAGWFLFGVLADAFMGFGPFSKRETAFFFVLGGKLF
jgi:hypothetical protein